MAIVCLREFMQPPPPQANHPTLLSSLPPPQRYESGDHVAVYPANDTSLVNELGAILGADLDTVFSLNNLDGEWLFFSPLHFSPFLISFRHLSSIPYYFFGLEGEGEGGEFSPCLGVGRCLALASPWDKPC